MQCSPQALSEYRGYAFAIVSVSALSLSISGPRFDSVESSFFFFFFSFSFFFLPLFLLSLFLFFSLFDSFFPPFLSSSNFPLVFLHFFFLLIFSHSIFSSHFLFSSPFCCFSFSLSSLSSFLPPPCRNACPTPPPLLQKTLGRTLVCYRNAFLVE